MIPESLVQLAGSEKGTSMIESAVVLPVLLMMIAGIVDFGTGFAKKLDTQQAATRTAELASNAGVDPETGVAMLRREAASAANVPESQATVTMTLECAGVVQVDPSQICAAGQETNRYVKINIKNYYDPILKGLLPIGDRPLEFEAKASVRIQ